MERIPGDGRRECVCQLPKSHQKGWEVRRGFGLTVLVVSVPGLLASKAMEHDGNVW